MKTIKTIVVMTICALAPVLTQANPFLNTHEKDTVIIELENGSKVIIYTKDKAELKRLLAYDINEMVRDLNASVQESDEEYIEMDTEGGAKYMVDSPTVMLGDKEVEGDTIYVDEKALDNIRIRIGGMELFLDPNELENMDEDDYEFQKYSYVDKNRGKTKNYFTVDFGVSNWLENGNLPSATDANYAVKPWGSWYVGANIQNRTWISGPLVLEWGGGVNWYNFKLENSDVQIVKGEDQIEFNEFEGQIAGLKSKISSTYLNVNFVPMLDFGKGARNVKATTGDGFSFKSSTRKGFRIGAGVYGGYRIGSSTKWVYKEDGDTDRIKEKDHFFLENFRYGIRGQLGFGSFDMFVLYDLNDVFVEGRGPGGASLNAFTIGVTM